jgi:DNA invertase Pin-like site-specific DNA recombinase
MLTVLGGLAEFERELIRARTGEELSLLARETSGDAIRIKQGQASEPTTTIPYALLVLS